MDLELGELYTIEVSAATSAGFGEAAKSTIKTGDPEIASMDFFLKVFLLNDVGERKSSKNPRGQDKKML